MGIPIYTFAIFALEKAYLRQRGIADSDVRKAALVPTDMTRACGVNEGR